MTHVRKTATTKGEPKKSRSYGIIAHQLLFLLDAPSMSTTTGIRTRSLLLSCNTTINISAHTSSDPGGRRGFPFVKAMCPCLSVASHFIGVHYISDL